MGTQATETTFELSRQQAMTFVQALNMQEVGPDIAIDILRQIHDAEREPVTIALDTQAAIAVLEALNTVKADDILTHTLINQFNAQQAGKGD